MYGKHVLNFLYDCCVTQVVFDNAVPVKNIAWISFVAVIQVIYGVWNACPEPGTNQKTYIYDMGSWLPDLAMNFQKVVLLTILLGLIVSAVSAADPDRIQLSTDADWLVANGVDSAVISIQALDASGVPLKNCTVALGVDPIYGRISPATVTTGVSGITIATFTASRTSGTAVITARAGAVEETLRLSIDHDLPCRVTYLDYESEVTAGATTTITVGLADLHGNMLNDQRVAETVRFSAGSVDDDAAFIDDGGDPVPELERTVNATGFVQVPFRTSRTVGENIVRIGVLQDGTSRYISIHGQPTGIPAAIAVAVSPDADPVPYQPADSESMFTLTYRLFDAWGNPAAGRDVRVVTSLAGEEVVLTTNGMGVACLTYGPKDTTGIVTLTATAVDNASVTIAQEVEFIHTDPVNMLLSASPQSMPSRDVDRNSVAELRAKVMDVKGNPVDGETVTFAIVPGSINLGGSNSTEDPYLGEIPGQNVATAVTISGSAIVKFHPGSFAPPEVGKKASARGNVTVRATWENVSRDIILTWMNYPYLSVETEVSDQRVLVNNTTDVTVRLKGDGWALRPDPIDVVLVVDRSGSMAGTDVNPTRMAAAKAAANDFVDQMSLTAGDRVALVSFAFGATLDQELTDEESEIKGAINRLPTDGGTNMRMAYYTAIKYLKEKGRPEAVKAVILMSDGDWNYHGSPLAKGVGYADNNRYLTRRSSYGAQAPLSGYCWSGLVNSYDFSDEKYEWYHDLPNPKGGADVQRQAGWGDWYDTEGNRWVSTNPASWTCDNGQFTNQNMSVYANSGDETNRVKIYSIGFASRLNSDVERGLSVLSRAAGGKYVWAKDEAALKNVYTDIAGELKTEAGIDTTMVLDFDMVRVNDEDREGKDVFDYIYEDGVSTTVESWVENETGHHEIIPLTTINQTDDWNDDHTLQFDVGTVHLDQTWEATFRLRVLTDGNINIFGPNSTITFNDGAAELGLPDTFITAVPDLNNTGLGAATLTLSNPRYTCTEPVEEFLTAAWDLTYTGSTTATEFVEYSNDGGLSWVRFDTLTADGTVADETSSLDVLARPPGEYQVRIRAFADDAPDAVLIFPSIRVGELRAAYIRLA